MSRDNRLIMLSLFLWGSGEGMFLYILPLYMEKNLGAAPEEVGGVLALAALLTACSYIPGGWLADRFDPKKVMLGGWALGGLASIMMGLATSWQAFIPGVLIYNVSAYCIPAINTYVAQASGDAPLEHTLTLTFAGYAAGSILAPFIGGRLAESIGAASLFLIGGAIFFISMMFSLQVSSHPITRSTATESLTHSSTRQARSLRPALPFLIRISYIFLALWIGATLVANYLGTLGWSLGDVNTLGGTAQALGMTLLAVALGRVAASRRRAGLILGQGVVWLAMLLLMIATPALRLPSIVAYFLLGGAAPVRELANAQVAGLVDPGVRGLALGLNETLHSLARSVAAGMAGLLYTSNVQLPLIVSIGLIPIGIAWTALARRSIEPPEEIIVLASSGPVMVESIED
jgi:predicted MFS family arabinose efflux permease